MSEKPDHNAQPHSPSPLPAAMAACIATAQARRDALRCAAQAYHALELLLATAMRAKSPALTTHQSEVAALLALVREESTRRLDEALEAMEAIEELCEAKRAKGGG